MLVNTAGLKTTLNAIKEYIRRQIGKIKRPDWNQNDESAQDYIKNRTHWKSEGNERYKRVPLRTILRGHDLLVYIGDRGFVGAFDAQFQEYPFAILATSNDAYFSQIHLNSLNYKSLSLMDASGRIVAKKDLTQAKENKTSDKLISYVVMLEGDDRIPLRDEYNNGYEFTVVLETKTTYHKISQEYLPENVLYSSKQTLTEAQQKQARANIGALDVNIETTPVDTNRTFFGVGKNIVYVKNGWLKPCPADADKELAANYANAVLGFGFINLDISVVKGEAKSAFSLYQQGLISDKGTILKNPLDVAQYITWTVGITNNKTYIDYRHVEHNGFYEYCRYFEDDTYSNLRASYSLSNYMSDSEPRGSVSQFRMSAAPTEDMHIATKQYVDTAKTEALQLGLTTATPGKTIKVKTVQDGKPTEWEAVDMPSQPDWNQNDNTKPDYIKNRPLIATNDDAMDLLAEIGIITPITNSNGEILTSSSNEIYSL